MSDSELDIQVITESPTEPEELDIQVLSEHTNQGYLDIQVLSETNTRKGEFKNWLTKIKGGLGRLLGDQSLDIQILNQIDMPLQSFNVQIPQTDLDDGKLSIAVLRTYVSAARTFDISSWGNSNPEKKRALYSKENDSAFDLPQEVSVSVTDDINTEIEVLQSSPATNGEVIWYYDENWVNTSVAVLNETYGSEVINTPISLTQHHKQEHVFGGEKLDGRNVSSCLPASLLNALDAIGRLNGRTESQIIDDLGKTSAFNSRGGMDLPQVGQLLSRENIPYYPADSLTELARDLELGGVAIIASGNHARLISGFESDGNGNMFFRLNDPLRTEVTRVAPTQLADMIAQGINEQRQISEYDLPTNFSCFIIQPNLRIQVV